MSPADEPEGGVAQQPAQGAPPLPNRFNRGTLAGCLGIVCVLALPAILFLPIETWGLPEWTLRLVPLPAMGCALGGAALLLRVAHADAATATARGTGDAA